MSIELQSAIRQAELAQKAAPELAKLKKATDGFESIFLKKLFGQMRASVKETKLGESFGKEIFDDMFNEAMANAAAKSKTLGMGDMLYNQFAPRIMNSVASQEMRNKASKAVSVETQEQPVGPTEDLQDKESGLKGRIFNPHVKDSNRSQNPAGSGTHDQAGHATARKS